MTIKLVDYLGKYWIKKVFVDNCTG